MKILIIIAIICIPVIYSGFYLKAFWDPYGNIENIPVAIVNLDKGAKEENFGKEAEEKLLEEKVLDFEIVDKQTAENGLKEKKYYAVITIPENFSENLTSAETINKEKAIITYEPNQKTNFLASQIISKVVSTVQAELVGQVNERVVSTLAENLEQVPEKMEDIQNAIGEVQEGNNQLGEGLSTLKQGTTKLSNNYAKFDQGIQSASNGSKELSQGANQLETGLTAIQTGSKALSQGAKELTNLQAAVGKLTTGSKTLSKSVEGYTQGTNQLTQAMQQILIGIVQYGQANPELLADAQFQTLYGTAKAIQDSGKIEKLQTAGDNLITGTNTLEEGIQTLASNATQLEKMQQGIEQLEQAIGTAKQGSGNIVAGAATLEQGLTTLKTNSTQVQNGVNELNSGASQLVSGNEELKTGLATFKQEVTEGTKQTQEELAKLEGINEYAKAPVAVQENDYGKIENYGMSFAPYFMSISLWIGALMSFVVFYYDYNRRFKILGKGAKHKNLRNLCYLLIAVAQAIVLGSILKAVLGFQVSNIWTYYGTCILVSLVFTSMIQLMITQLGDVGKFLAVLLLVLQLAACGGTFPIETEPSFFQAIYPYMPMTYTLNLFKEAIIMREPGLIMNNVIALLSIFAGFLIVTVILQILKKGREKVAQVKNEKTIAKKEQKMIE